MGDKYRHLKGKFIEFISPYGHIHKDCFVAEVDEVKGLTIMCTFVRWKDDPMDTNYNTIEKVYCLDIKYKDHEKMLPYAVEGIEMGRLESSKVYSSAGVQIGLTIGGEPQCAFE